MKPEDFPLSSILRVDASPNLPLNYGFRVCVSGGRDHDDEEYVWACLNSFGPIREIGFGCAAGVDTFALEWAKENGIPWRRYVADWDRRGTSAGSVRNGAMLADFKPDRLLVFDGGTGTTDCTRKARKWEIERVFYTRDDDDQFASAQRWG